MSTFAFPSILNAKNNPARGEDIQFAVLGSVSVHEARALINEWKPQLDLETETMMWKHTHDRADIEEAVKLGMSLRQFRAIRGELL